PRPPPRHPFHRMLFEVPEGITLLQCCQRGARGQADRFHRPGSHVCPVDRPNEPQNRKHRSRIVRVAPAMRLGPSGRELTTSSGSDRFFLIVESPMRWKSRDLLAEEYEVCPELWKKFSCSV